MTNGQVIEGEMMKIFRRLTLGGEARARLDGCSAALPPNSSMSTLRDLLNNRCRSNFMTASCLGLAPG